MKFTLSWLKEHLDTDEPLDALADTLTMIGLEVEGIEDKAKALAPSRSRAVIEAKQHPNADRLRVCIVDTGAGEPVQVVCGAPNARTGMKGVFSPPGTYIPGKKITLGVGTIRGVESRGMLVSEAEMELSDDHDGIIDLPDDAPVGESYAKWAGLDDPVIEINLTPNRPDCTGVHGIARDLAAAGMGKLIDPAPKPVKGTFPCPVSVKLDIAGRSLSRLRAAPRARREERAVARMDAEAADRDRAAPDQRARRHHQLHDLRPRPPAARVRRRQGARQSHRAPRASGREPARARRHDLPARRDDVRDRRREGGRVARRHHGRRGHRLLGETTTDVLIESALWEPLNIAQTGRKLGINSRCALPLRARRRSDLHGAGPRSLRRRWCSISAAARRRRSTVAGSAHAEDRIIEFPVSEVKRLAGLDVPLAEMKRVPEPPRLLRRRARARP